MPILQAIIFDLDDTLYPEYEFVKSGFNAVAVWVERHLGIPQKVALEGFLSLFNKGKRGNIFDLWLDSQGFPPELWVTKMVKVYREHRPHITPYQDVLALLPRLRRAYRLGIVSDGHSYVQKRKLEALGLTPFFDAVVFSDELGDEAWKPSTVPFKTILEKLKSSGCRSVYVADNPLKDFLGARAMGMWTIRIRRPKGLYSHLEPPSYEHAPHVEISTLEELPKVLVHIEKELMDRLKEVDGHG